MITLTSYCQITKKQKNRLIRNITPELLQEWADNKINVPKLDSVIKAREALIDTLQYQLKAQREKYINDLKEIALNNKKANEKDNEIKITNKEIDSINETIIQKLNKKRFDWGKFHLSAGFDTPLVLENWALKWRQSVIKAKLNYEIKKFNIGAVTQFKSKIKDEKPILASDWFITFNYNIF